MIWRDLFVFSGLLFKSKAPQNLLRASVCGSKLRIRCCVLLHLDLTWARIGQRTSETTCTSLPPIWPKTGRRINSPTRLKTGRRFSFSDLSLTINAQPGGNRSLRTAKFWPGGQAKEKSTRMLSASARVPGGSAAPRGTLGSRMQA